MKKLTSKKYLINAIFILSTILFFFGACNPHKNEKYQINESIDINEIDILKLKSGYAKGDFTIKEITQIYLERINQLDFNGPELGSIIQINPDAIKVAEKLDKEKSSTTFFAVSRSTK